MRRGRQDSGCQKGCCSCCPLGHQLCGGGNECVALALPHSVPLAWTHLPLQGAHKDVYKKRPEKTKSHDLPRGNPLPVFPIPPKGTQCAVCRSWSPGGSDCRNTACPLLRQGRKNVGVMGGESEEKDNTQVSDVLRGNLLSPCSGQYRETERDGACWGNRPTARGRAVTPENTEMTCLGISFLP